MPVYNRQSLADALLYPDRSVSYRGMLAPYLKRTVTDPIDDVSEYEQKEFAMPSLLFDPLKGLVGMGQMLRGERSVDPREITKTALDIGMLSAPVGFFGGVPKGAVLGANVFHGTPHRFAPEPDFPLGRPRLDKIGTGEGAQAYGYGFYSADAPGVAESYKTSSKAWEFDGVPFADIDKEFPSPFHIGGDPEARRAAYLFDGYDSLDEAFKSQRYNIARHKAEGNVEIVKREENILQEMQELAPRISNTEGTLYKLDLPDADVAKYLDYDAPLSEQPKHIQKAWAEFKKSELGVLADESLHGTISAGRGEFSNPTGKDIYGAFVEGAASKVGSDKWAEKADYKLANEVLRKAGISGLKYFDQGSRAGGEGTRNYVTWDQDVLNRSKMLERDGVALTANKVPTNTPSGLLDDVGIETTQRGNVLEISKIETPDSLRGQGLADQKLDQLIQQADLDGTTLALTPSNAFGANKSRLTKWYKRHGFVPNKGRNKNFTTRESMVRPAKKSSGLLDDINF